MDYPNKSGNDNFGELVRLGWQVIVREGKAAIHRRLGGGLYVQATQPSILSLFP
jgi:hypothetical protein